MHAHQNCHARASHHQSLNAIHNPYTSTSHENDLVILQALISVSLREHNFEKIRPLKIHASLLLPADRDTCEHGVGSVSDFLNGMATDGKGHCGRKTAPLEEPVCVASTLLC